MGSGLWSSPMISCRAILLLSLFITTWKDHYSSHREQNTISELISYLWTFCRRCCKWQQLYLIFEPSEAGVANDNMEFLIKEISQWLIANFICKNNIKTDISFLCSIHSPPPILHPLRVGDEFISASNFVTHSVHLETCSKSDAALIEKQLKWWYMRLDYYNALFIWPP